MDQLYSVTATLNFVNGEEADHQTPPMPKEAALAAIGLALESPLVTSIVCTIAKLPDEIRGS